MSLLGQSGVTGGGLDPYNVHALFVNMDNMWTERFGNYDCLVHCVYMMDEVESVHISCHFSSAEQTHVFYPGHMVTLGHLNL